jgi:hypothetical protein
MRRIVNLALRHQAQLALKFPLPHAMMSKVTSSKQTVTVHFPQELYGRIFQFVFDRSDLYALLYVCRAFHHEAERVLYETVDLDYHHGRIYTWSRVVATCPRLASLVKSLTFGIVYSTIPTQNLPWLQVIAQGLKSLINLTELNLNKKCSQFLPRSYVGILRGTPFRLKTFRNDMFDLEPTLPFLALQSDITTWHHLNAKECSYYDANILPLLTDAAIPSWLLLTCQSRNITHLHTAIKYESINNESRIVGTLAGYRRTLTMLMLERHVTSTCMKLGDFVTCLAGSLPLIECLYLWQHGEMDTDSSMKTIVDSFSPFIRLTTLYIQPPRDLQAHSLYKNVLLPRDAVKTASCFVQVIPTLTRVAFTLGPREETLWYAKTRDVAMAGDIVIGGAS